MRIGRPIVLVGERLVYDVSGRNACGQRVRSVSARTITCCPTATVRAPIESTAVHEPTTLCLTYTLLTAPIVVETAAPNGATRPARPATRAHAALGFPRLPKRRRLFSSNSR